MSESGPKPILTKFSSVQSPTANSLSDIGSFASDEGLLHCIKVHRANATMMRGLLGGERNLVQLGRLARLFQPSQMLQLGLDQSEILQDIYLWNSVQGALENPNDEIRLMINNAFLRGGLVRPLICGAPKLYRCLDPKVIVQVAEQDSAFFAAFVNEYDDELRGLLSMDHYVEIAKVYADFAKHLVNERNFVQLATKDHLFILAKAHFSVALVVKNRALWKMLASEQQAALVTQYNFTDVPGSFESAQPEKDEPEKDVVSAMDQLSLDIEPTRQKSSRPNV